MTFGETNKLEGGENTFTKNEVSVFGKNVENKDSANFSNREKLKQEDLDKIIYSNKNDRLKIKNEIEKSEIKKEKKSKIKELFESIDVKNINKNIDLKKEIVKEKNIDKKEKQEKTENDYFKDFDKRIERDETLSLFAKTKKGRLFLEYITKYSSINIEKLSSIIQKSSEAFDIDEKYFVSLFLGEFDASKKKSPFLVNDKGIGQFTSITWGDLYGKNANVLNYFKTKKKNKYYNNLKNLNITSLADRGNPDLAIMGVGSYLQYINIARELDGDYYKAVAMYNVGLNKLIEDFIKYNPVVVKNYHNLFGVPENKSDYEYEKMLIASKKYYAKYTKNA